MSNKSKAAVALVAVVGSGVLTSCDSGRRAHEDDSTLRRYAADTWKAVGAMVDPVTGLPTGSVDRDLRPASRPEVADVSAVRWYASAAIAARDLGIITAGDARSRMDRLLRTLSGLRRHKESGMFYRVYELRTGAVRNSQVASEDNATLAASLMMLRAAEPRLRAQAQALLAGMNFRYFYNPDGKAPGVGLMHGSFYETRPAKPCTRPARYVGTGPPLHYTCSMWTGIGDTRMVSYVGIALKQIPPSAYFALYRTKPDTGSCPAGERGLQEQKPVGTWKTHEGVRVFEGTYGYRGARLLPTAQGTMFEELAPSTLVPDDEWGAGSWGRNHPVYVRAQIEHGLTEARYGYWGFSAGYDPFSGKYKVFGVDAIGTQPNGPYSDREGTGVDLGYGSCRSPRPARAFGEGIISPRASFLALPHAKDEALANLARLRAGFPQVYGPGGFVDMIGVRSGTTYPRYKMLAGGMTLASIANLLRGGTLRRYFAEGEATANLAPVLRQETWDVHPAP
ncbi:glucoamylase family protein [Spirillospora sp. CA-294931]|uniref:glucoamylase family protein n=1 Tax=Spirillospora sp. CA-294931 TaxID=3240042 RepID=UPI003D8BA44E